jgi:hypothetical protein
MLIIRDEQMAVLRSHGEERFVADQCAQWLLDDPALAPDVVRGWVEAGLARARGYGFRANSQLELFVDAMIVFGPEFDLSDGHGWRREILAADLDAAVKWQAFQSRVHDELVREGRL